MQQRIYALTKVERLIQTNGVLRKLEEKDIVLVSMWIADFQTCVTPGETIQLKKAKKVAQQQFQKNGLYLYEIEGKAVSMANTTRPINKSITVNLVYTPSDRREKGYASDCVAALSQLCLDQGYDSVLLYTDLSNPTSNHIYQQIGFKPVADSISLKLI
ncbi:GNAT family N-acetyltransferase [Bacillus sp. JCM 19041]|uniref:GNAT family N-acetyltransferase n=1 Tax=Bacillus sp. JCM 19041 TaxID=1460637 RepID=UPI0006D0B555